MNKSLFFGLCICLLIGVGSVEATIFNLYDNFDDGTMNTSLINFVSNVYTESGGYFRKPNSAGASEMALYNFQNITLDNNSTWQVEWLTTVGNTATMDFQVGLGNLTTGNRVNAYGIRFVDGGVYNSAVIKYNGTTLCANDPTCVLSPTTSSGFTSGSTQKIWSNSTTFIYYLNGAEKGRINYNTTYPRMTHLNTFVFIADSVGSRTENFDWINITINYTGPVTNSISLNTISPLNNTYSKSNTIFLTGNITSITGVWNVSAIFNGTNVGTRANISTTGFFNITTSALAWNVEYPWYFQAKDLSSNTTVNTTTQYLVAFNSTPTAAASCVVNLGNAYFIPNGCTSTY